MGKISKKIWAICLVSAMIASLFTGMTALADSDPLADLKAYTSKIVYTKHFNLGGSHYAYTEAISDRDSERNFYPGSALCVYDLNTQKETVLLEDPTGVIRNPDVSFDAKRILFSWKKSLNEDDYHIYEYDLQSGTYRQLTFGQHADYEAIYLPDGNIMFVSSRCEQTVDCNPTPVSNLYLMNGDGEYIRQIGFDQVHTNYPFLTEDGRVSYTRWDYNDRGQIYTQPLFVMNPDGTNQTELYGNNSFFPTTILQARQMPGTQKFIATLTGHHSFQAGKIGIIDPTEGRQENEGVYLVGPLTKANGRYEDSWGQEGAMYQFPYPINDRQFMVCIAPNGWQGNKFTDTHFGLYFMDVDGNKTEIITDPTTSINQPVPLKERTPFQRPSMVDFREKTGTYYLSDIYEGQNMANVKRGEIKKLRVIELEYRPTYVGDVLQSGAGGGANMWTPISVGNGSWDVKHILGEVPVYEDGSALFKVPARTPLYFQALNENNEVVQTMRSWTTLQPNETYSCVGCHESKNSAPPYQSKPSMAMAAGVAEITEPYEGSSEEGFSFNKQIQPILDANCVTCHNNQEKAEARLDIDPNLRTNLNTDDTLMGNNTNWKYSTNKESIGDDWYKDGYDDSDWRTSNGIFSSRNWPESEQKPNEIWIRSTFDLLDLSQTLRLHCIHFNDAEVYINGVKAATFTGSNWNDEVVLSNDLGLKLGKNRIAVHSANTEGNRVLSVSLTADRVLQPGESRDQGPVETKSNVIETVILPVGRDSGVKWQYTFDKNIPDNWYMPGFDDSKWQTKSGSFYQQDDWPANPGELWPNEIWIRSTFTMTDLSIPMTIKYMHDEDAEVYINGVNVMKVTGYNDQNYLEKTISDSVKETLNLKTGNNANTIAVHCKDTEGGRLIDVGLVSKTIDTSGEDAFSLKGETVYDSRAMRDWSLSYLLLTGAYPQEPGAAGTYGVCDWKGNENNPIVTWISSMSTPQEIEPKSFGSMNSTLISMLENGHGNVKLSDEELYKLKAWIDLAVPYSGSYTENSHWDEASTNRYNYFAQKRIDTKNEEADNIAKMIDHLYGGQQKYAPEAPENVSLERTASGAILTWSKSVHAQQYSIYRSTSPDSGFSLMAEGVTGTKYIDASAPNSKKYYYCVTASNAIGESKKSKTVEADELSKDISVSVVDASGETKFSGAPYTNDGALEVNTTYAAGDKLVIKTTASEAALRVQLSDTFKETVVYVKDGTFEFPIPIGNNSYDQAAFEGSLHQMTVIYASEKDLKEYRNLAYNPYAVMSKDANVYPFATATSECYNATEFAARNAIDGYTKNDGHGAFPLQSWGPDKVNNIEFKIDFGRTVTADKIGIVVRHDGLHDIHWKSGTLVFSDGTTQDFNLGYSSNEQVIEFKGGKKDISWVKITNLVSADASGQRWPAFTEVMVYGADK